MTLNNNVVYKLTNQENEKIYVGITNNFSRRMREHRNKAFSESSKPYFSYLSNAIRKHGWGTFKVSILEEGLSREVASLLEEKYIEEFQSNDRQYGYNLTSGGDNPKTRSTILNFEQVDQIYQLITRTYRTFEDIGEEFGVNDSMISNINLGKQFAQEGWTFPLRSQSISEDELFRIGEDLESSSLTIAELAEKYKRSYSSIQRFNSGQTYSGFWSHYPIRRGKSSSYPIVAVSLQTGKIIDFKNIQEAADFVINHGLTRGGKEKSIKGGINRAINAQEHRYKHQWHKADHFYKIAEITEDGQAIIQEERVEVAE